MKHLRIRPVSRFKFLFLVPLLLLSLFSVLSITPPARAATPVALYIDPPTQSAQPPGSTVTVQVSVVNMPLFNAWDIRVRTNALALNSVKVDVSGNVLSSNGLSIIESVNCVNGSGIGCSFNDLPIPNSDTSIVHSAVGASGSPPPSVSSYTGPLFTITFTAGSASVTGILLINYGLSIAGFDIPHNTYAATNAIYGNGKLPIVDFTWRPIFPFIGDNVIFNASASDPNPTGTIATYNWDFQEQNQFPITTTNNITAHVFKNCISGCRSGNRSLIFPVTLTVTDNLTIANSKTAYIAVNPHPVHDLAISDIRATPETDIPAGSKVSIDVVVLNNGTFTEGAFTIYANVSSLNTKLPVKDLGSQVHAGNIVSGDSAHLFFTWDTSRNPSGTYQIEAWVPPIRNATNAIVESNIANNVHYHLVSIAEPSLRAFFPLSIPEALGLAALIIGSVMALRGWMRNTTRRKGLLSEKL